MLPETPPLSCPKLLDGHPSEPMSDTQPWRLFPTPEAIAQSLEKFVPARYKLPQERPHALAVCTAILKVLVRFPSWLLSAFRRELADTLTLR